ncbi:MAG: FtsW/RodA/SpoVE family cell cycle protein [Thiotrichaceae bacterium]
MLDPLYYFWKQLIYTSLGVSLAILVLFIPMKLWRILSVPLLFIGIILLILILIPGVGHAVNGSMRWLYLGGSIFNPLN